MEENKTTQVSLTTVFLILAVVIIVVMGILMYKFYSEKIEANEETSKLQSQVNSLNGAVSDLQGKIDNISETINSNNSIENTSTTNNSTSFTDEQVKTALSNYLELNANAHCDYLLETLTEKGKLNYDSSKNTILNDDKVITSIKFSDYKNAMLNYVTESEFEKNWTSAILDINENSDGYLTKVQGGGGLRVYTINSITKINNSTYFAETIATLADEKDRKEDENFTVIVKSYNGNCVIDSIK